MQKISISGPAELITIVPFHLGFQPERSVVVMCFVGKAIGLVARVDAVGSAEAARVAVQLMPAIRREGTTSVALVSYEEARGEGRPLAHAVGAALGIHGIDVVEDLVVLDGRWYCARDDDCADEGEELPAAADVPGVASYVAVGRSVLSGRDALEALVTPLADEADERLVAAIEAWRRDYDRARETCFLHLLEEVDAPPEAEPPEPGTSPHGRPQPPGDPSQPWAELMDECLSGWGRLLRGGLADTDLHVLLPAIVGPLEDRDLRDALIGWLCPGLLPAAAIGKPMLGRLEALVGRVDGLSDSDDEFAVATSPGAGRGHTRPRLQDVLDLLCRATPRRFAAPVLSVCASHAWWSGDGARAGMCVDTALELDPEHSLSRLIRLGLDHGVRPEAA